jgi:DNA-binding CsgD family transcriptional regulator
VSEVEAGMALAEDTGAQAMTLLSHAILSCIALGRGELERTEAHLAAGHRVSATTGHLFGLDVLLWANAGWLEAQGELDAARDLLTATWQQLEPIRWLTQYRNLAPDLIRLVLSTGDRQRADAVADDLERAARSNTAASSAAAALRGRGLATGDADLLVRAVDRYRATPRRVEHAATCVEAAEVLLSAGRDAEGEALLEEATTLHLDIGAHHGLARIDALVGSPPQVGRSAVSPASSRHGWDALSRKEHQVVALIAQGLSNPEIGRQLFISRRTVETHLSHIFKKLGVANRVQLAATALARDRPGHPPG